MLTDPPVPQSPRPPAPLLAEAADLIEKAAAASSDPFAFAVSQLLSAIAYAEQDGEPIPTESLTDHAYRITRAWLRPEGR
jgi:hypothetical protein